jgi:DNA-3-methyladenine glycosylase
VAPLLLGCTLVSHANGHTTGGLIVEVEAYRGHLDPASHAYGPKSPRNSPMYESAGTLYVYRSYGIHACMNIVTGGTGDPQAILLRALEPTIGLSAMQERRSTDVATNLASGPGKLCEALGVTLELSGTRLGGAVELWPRKVPLNTQQIMTGPRIGITKAVTQPWRFYLKNSPYVSGRRKF